MGMANHWNSKDKMLNSSTHLCDLPGDPVTLRANRDTFSTGAGVTEKEMGDEHNHNDDGDWEALNAVGSGACNRLENIGIG